MPLELDETGLDALVHLALGRRRFPSCLIVSALLTITKDRPVRWVFQLIGSAIVCRRPRSSDVDGMSSRDQRFPACGMREAGGVGNRARRKALVHGCLVRCAAICCVSTIGASPCRARSWPASSNEKASKKSNFKTSSPGAVERGIALQSGQIRRILAC